MILNAVLCDYLRLTSFSHADHKQFLLVFNEHKRDVQSTIGHRMQYDGMATNHGFVGSGAQGKRRHYLTEYSGAASHLAYTRLIDAELVEERCTRIDVQMSIDLPKKYDARKLYDRIEGNLPHNRGVTLYQSPGGLSTIYMGSRKTKNGRFTRLYVKEHEQGRALRFETEIKGTWAEDYWIYLRTGGELKEILVAELESLGDIDFAPLNLFYKPLKGYLPAPRPRAVETSNATLEWLLRTVEPVLIRMLNDHDHGWKVRHWLETLLDWSRK